MFEHLNNYFTDDERAALKAGASAWDQLKRHESWAHWLAVGRAIATVLDAAAKATNQTSGKSFNSFMARAYSTQSYLGDFADMNKAVRSLAAKCWHNREAIEKWRSTIG